MADGRLLSPDYIYPNLPTLPPGQKVKLACPTWEVRALLNYVITFSACKDTNNLSCLPMMWKESGSVTRAVVCDSATWWPIARQVPLPLEFSRQGYWSGLPSPSLGIFPTRDWTYISWIAGRFFTIWATREALPWSDSRQLTLPGPSNSVTLPLCSLDSSFIFLSYMTSAQSSRRVVFTPLSPLLFFLFVSFETNLIPW